MRAKAHRGGMAPAAAHILLPASAQPPRDRRAEPVGEPQGQSAPERDLEPVFRIERIDLARLPPIRDPHRIGERTRLEPPILLERISAGADFRAAEVEAGAAAARGATHQFVIERLIRAPLARFAGAATPKGMDNSLVEEAEHARQRPAI